MGRAIDLSSGAAQAIGVGSTGNVSMESVTSFGPKLRA